MHKTIVVVVTLAVLGYSSYVCGQDPSAQGTELTPGSNPEENRKREIQAMSTKMRALVARKTFLEKLVTELNPEVKRLEIRQQAAKDLLAELQTALDKAKRSNGNNQLGTMRVSYDNSAEIQRITKLVFAAKTDVTTISARLGKVQNERATAENELSTIGFDLREQRIALTGMGVNVEPLMAAPAQPKISRPTGPAVKKIYVTKDGRIISAAGGDLKDGTWTITTVAGKTIEVEESEIEKILDKQASPSAPGTR